MLNHDKAAKALEKFKIKNWEKTRVTALAELPEKLRAAGMVLFNRNAAGKQFTNWQHRHKASEAAGVALSKASPKEREKLFLTLFPKLGKEMEATWQLFDRLPYETTTDRKAFRAPGDTSAHQSARMSWLTQFVNSLSGYDPDIVWVATWAVHLTGYYSSDCLGLLLASAIEAKGDQAGEVFEILKDSASNQHEIAGMGRHVTRALLVSSRQDAWEFVEKLLLAAQRQEGLRSVILESVDETHPEAFKRMLRLILEENLLRFSSVVRAVDVWFGLAWDSLTPAVLKRTIEVALTMLTDEKAREEALASDKGDAAFLALYAIAFEDAHKAIEPATKLLQDQKSVERRFLGVHFLRELDLPAAKLKLIDALDDPDLRIAVHALPELPQGEDAPDLWDRIIKLLDRMPARAEEGKFLVWPWVTFDLDRKEVANKLLDYLGKRPPTALVPFLKEIDSYERGNVIDKLAKMKTWDNATRDTLFELVGDRDGWVRNKALEALKKCEVGEPEAQRIEALLVRKNSEMRQAVLTLLRKQKPPAVLASADRLLASKKANQRLSGLELLRLQVEKKKTVPECRSRAEAYRAKYPKLSEDEELHLEVIFDTQRVKPTLKNALGLMDPAQRSQPVEPVARKVTLCTPATMALLKSLDDLIHSHRTTPVVTPGYQGEEEQLLGDMMWGFPSPSTDKPIAAQIKDWPLAEIWQEWYDKRPAKLKDSDGLEVLRAYAWYAHDAADWKGLVRRMGKNFGDFLKLAINGQTPVKLRYSGIIADLLQWFLRLHPPAGAADFLLDALETAFASVPEKMRDVYVDPDNWSKRNLDWRNDSPADMWQNEVNAYQNLEPSAWTEKHEARLWQLLHWRDEPKPGVARMRPELSVLMAGCNAGLTTEADLYDHLIGPGQDNFSDLGMLTRAGAEELKKCPALVPIVDRIRERVLEIELTRGEMATAASELVDEIHTLVGMETLFRVLGVLGTKAPARRTYGTGRIEVLTSLLKACIPGPGDTPEEFTRRVKADKISKDRLLQLAFLAPAWLDFIEPAVGWPGLKEGVWWFLVHSDGHSGLGRVSPDPDDDFDDFDDMDEIDDEALVKPVKLNPWLKAIQERTTLSPADRNSGAVDAAWFHRVFEPLGRKRWDALGEVAKFGGGNVKKAQRLANVLQGREKKAALVSDIRTRNLKEPVRLLGLLPLPVGEKREPELLSRYQVLIGYRRYARSLSPMSREDAERTATVGLENLARTAGYPDPVRLEWAMEARQIADLAAGPISVTHDGVTVTLAIDAQAQPELTVARGEKPLKAIPPQVRKNKKVAALAERRTELKRQASRVKQSLEAMMVRGDEIRGHELRTLFAHPLLRPLLERLVLVGEGIMGYPVADGQALEDHAGKKEPVKQDERLRLAHPFDLYHAKNWDRWQADCFARERVQPFKQVFRELYVLTAQEKADGKVSHRYSGQQINPGQGMALFGTRGWRTQDGVEKTFYSDGIVASVSFRHHGWTAAQVEGLALESIEFRKRGDWELMRLEDVPPRIFSEVMRDGDLVVSVAHVGGVDPEASASTVQMREALVRETCALLGIHNYEVKSQHVLIKGQLGTYSLHLGSGVVHRQPGGYVCIVPVHAQQRGRLFLPFADDDPRTAEVISKMLLLARDNEIQDPTILEQLRQ